MAEYSPSGPDNKNIEIFCFVLHVLCIYYIFIAYNADYMPFDYSLSVIFYHGKEWQNQQHQISWKNIEK